MDLCKANLSSITISERAIVIGNSIFNCYTETEVQWSKNVKETTVAQVEEILVRTDGKDFVIKGNPSSRRLALGG